MLTLPKSVGILVQLAARDVSRYAMNGVQVVANGTESRLIASDGHVLGLVRGPTAPPGCEACVLIPSDAWIQAFKHCKDTRQQAGKVVVQPKALTSFEGAANTVVPFEPVSARFPDYMRVLPTHLPIGRASVNPWNLIRVLEVAGKFADTRGDKTGPRVEIFFYGNQAHNNFFPLGITARGLDDLAFDGLCMPLA